MTEQNKGSGFAVHFSTLAGCLMFIAVCMFFLLFFTRGLKTYIDYRTLEKEGVYTTAKVIKRIYEPGGKSLPTYYYITYEFENRSASDNCVLSEKYFTTPKGKACRTTVQIHEVLEDEYKGLKGGDDIDIIYLPSTAITKSVVRGMAFNEESSLFQTFFFLFLSLMSLVGLHKFVVKGMVDKSRA